MIDATGVALDLVQALVDPDVSDRATPKGAPTATTTYCPACKAPLTISSP